MCSLQDFEIDRQEEELPDETIKNNLRILKGNLKRSKSRYAKILRKSVGKVKSSELSWRDPLASQVLSSEMEMVKQLPEEEYESFMVRKKISQFIEQKIMFEMILLGTGEIYASVSS